MIRTLLRLGSPVLGLAIVFACAPADDAELTPDETQEMAQPAPQPVEDAPWTVDIEPGPAGANVVGSMQVEPVGNDTQVRLTLAGLAPGEHAWHIHNAPCGEQGPVVFPFTATADMDGTTDPVTAAEDGTATATATVPGDRLMRSELRNGRYSIHVHERGGLDHGDTVACANF
jgi:Cu/Zn superoxide dismutase